MISTISFPAESLPVMGMTKVVLKIPNMSCKHCVMRITKAIESVGAKGEVSLEEKKAVVEFDIERTTLDDIIGAIERYGYEVEVVGEGC
jgi:copper chaperone CopZ